MFVYNILVVLFRSTSLVALDGNAIFLERLSYQKMSIMSRNMRLSQIHDPHSPL